MSAPAGVLRSASQIAIGTLVSRVTGFARTVVLAAVLGNGLVYTAYSNANVLPNQVYELLLGGLLTSVVVPLLVRAQHDAAERGEDENVFAQRLFTLAVVGLGGATILGMFAAPLLVSIQGIGPRAPNHDLAALMALILLPQMVFYGIGALAGAVLNIRDSYSAPAWAPVANNILVILVGLSLLLPVFGGRRTTGSQDPYEGFSTTQILVLSIGTTLGIALQAFILIPAWRKVGFRWRWRFDWRGVGLGEMAKIGSWVLMYVILGQVGFTIAGRVANSADRQFQGGAQSLYGQWTIADLLFQLPYGILGVSLLTAIMPKLARAARDEDWPSVKKYLSDGSRLTGLALIPVSVAFWVLAVPLTMVFFNVGEFGAEAARSTGLILAAGSFGLLPYAITLLQLRVFFAARDSRTPVLIMVGIVAVRVVLSLLCLSLPPQTAVIGLAVANSAAFVVGAVIGDVVLRRRFGQLGTRGVVVQLFKTLIAAIIAVAVVIPVYLVLVQYFSGASVWNLGGLSGLPLLHTSKLGTLVALLISALVGLVV
ncbi:MAG: murein biosynthesis integral membrane protein MurJ, partial [Antricoccus sp.]